jgi:phosphate transport system substrate-binding protein
LHDILTGKITDWSAVGRDSKGPIHLFVQDDAAGTLDTAAGFVLGDASLAGGAKRLGSETDIAAAVAGNADAIGVVSFGHAGTARTVPVASGDAAPIEASELTVSTEDYALTRRLYLYTAQVPGSTVVRRFAEYATSASGQAVVEAAGFVPLTLRQTAVLVPEGASARFRALIAGATRVSIDFRFQPGSTELDSRSVHDIDQLVGFLRREHVDGSRLILAGFADSLGAPQANQIVSQRRVDAVVAALGRQGVTPGRTAVFGAELPVADNATPEGRERNRRVEVYLLP